RAEKAFLGTRPARCLTGSGLTGSGSTGSASGARERLRDVNGYDIVLSRRAIRDLAKAPWSVEKRVRLVIDKLARDPRPAGAIKLKGSERTWRVRVGDWRVIYDIYDDKLVVEVVRVPHRGDAYR